MKIEKIHIDDFGNYVVNDVMSVPNHPENRHYHMIQKWIDEGNTPTPYVEPEPHWIDKRLAKMADGGYGSIGEQLDMQYWDAVNGTTLWKDHIAKIKSDIPKE